MKRWVDCGGLYCLPQNNFDFKHLLKYARGWKSSSIDRRVYKKSKCVFSSPPSALLWETTTFPTNLLFREASNLWESDKHAHSTTRPRPGSAPPLPGGPSPLRASCRCLDILPLSTSACLSSKQRHFIHKPYAIVSKKNLIFRVHVHFHQ